MVAADEAHFTAVAVALERQVADLADRLDAQRDVDRYVAMTRATQRLVILTSA